MGRFIAHLERELERRFDTYRWAALADPAGFLAGAGKKIEIVVTGGETGLPNELLDQLPSLKIIAINGVGFDKVDLARCRERGVRVGITRGVVTEDVADLAVGMVIGLLRALPAADRFVRDGAWRSGPLPLARKVTGRRFGILGLGAIGTAAAARLAAFGPVSYCDPAAGSPAYTRFESPHDLARWCDVLLVTASAKAGSTAIIGREVLDALGPDGYLVNVARGSLVDEPALIEALAEGRIAGAALDVYANEPEVHPALRSASNVMLAPHIGTATAETRHAMAEMVLANLAAHAAGEPLPGGIC